jgi:hypothetical protein
MISQRSAAAKLNLYDVIPRGFIRARGVICQNPQVVFGETFDVSFSTPISSL